MTNERAITIIDDVNAYLASKNIYENDSIAGYTYRVICEALTQLKQSALEPAIHIPNNATNGDVIKAVFPYIEKYGTVAFNNIEDTLFTNINLYWWNAPYKAESENMK